MSLQKVVSPRTFPVSSHKATANIIKNVSKLQNYLNKLIHCQLRKRFCGLSEKKDPQTKDKKKTAPRTLASSVTESKSKSGTDGPVRRCRTSIWNSHKFPSTNSRKRSILSAECVLNSRCSKSRFFTFRSIVANLSVMAFFKSSVFDIPALSFRNSYAGLVCCIKNIQS